MITGEQRENMNRLRIHPAAASEVCPPTLRSLPGPFSVKSRQRQQQREQQQRLLARHRQLCQCPVDRWSKTNIYFYSKVTGVISERCQDRRRDFLFSKQTVSLILGGFRRASYFRRLPPFLCLSSSSFCVSVVSLEYEKRQNTKN